MKKKMRKRVKRRELEEENGLIKERRKEGETGLKRRGEVEKEKRMG